MTSVLYVSETWRPPANLDPTQFVIQAAGGLPQLLDSLRRSPVDVVLLDKRTWNLSANTISRWIKSIRQSVRIILLSDRLLLPHEIPPHIDAVINKEAPATLVKNTIAAILPD